MKTHKISEYEQQAIDFLEKTGTSFDIVRIGTFKYFPDDTEERDVYEVVLSNKWHTYNFNFGDSIHNTQCRLGQYQPHWKMTVFELRGLQRKKQREHRKPNAYDVLACLTTYDPGLFEDFCADYGCSDDSIKAEELYRSVRKEFYNVSKLFNEEELEQLAEIN